MWVYYNQGMGWGYTVAASQSTENSILLRFASLLVKYFLEIKTLLIFISNVFFFI